MTIRFGRRKGQALAPDQLGAGQAWVGDGAGNAVATAFPTAAQLQAIPTYAALSSDVSKSADATLTNVTGLAVPIGASATEVWWIEAFLRVVGSAQADDLKLGWTGPAGATMLWDLLASVTNRGFTQNTTLSGTPTTLTAIGGTVSVAVIANEMGVSLAGWLFGGGTAGNLQLQYAQNTSGGGTLSIKAGSLIRATKLAA